jgi:flagellar M-ring protein FliF
VQGLQLDEVAVVDQRGQVLSAEMKSDPLLGSATSLIRHRQQVEEYLSRKVEGMLEPVLGVGKAIVRVSAEIDFQAVTSTEERYDPDSAVVRSEVQTEDDSNTSEGRNGGLAGVSGNTPDAPEAAGGAPTIVNAQNRKNRTVSYEINRIVSNTTSNPGHIISLSAAVFVATRPATADGAPAAPRTVEELEKLRQIVVNTLGLKSTGTQNVAELISVQEMPFPTQEIDAGMVALQQETRIQSWVEVGVRYGAIGIALLTLVIFLRMLRRQRPEPLPVEMMFAQADGTASGAKGSSALTPELLNELIRQKPANVGLALRDWANVRKN